MATRNLTLQLDEKVIRDAKVIAARHGTSVSRMVANQIELLVAKEDRYEQARRRAMQHMDSAIPRGGFSWNRDDLYER